VLGIQRFRVNKQRKWRRKGYLPGQRQQGQLSFQGEVTSKLDGVGRKRGRGLGLKGAQGQRLVDFFWLCTSLFFIAGTELGETWQEVRLESKQGRRRWALVALDFI
jgi:hypothetical protein